MGKESRPAMTETWKDIPGFENQYQVSSEGRIRSLPRIILRSNNSPYTVQGRILRVKRHCVSGLLTVALVQGRRGHQHCAFVHRLVQSVFGEEAA
jgi:hypothetical protein